MAPLPSRWAVLWVRFNIVMFTAYALFGVFSLFWPGLLERLWLYPLHLGGLIFVCAILYGFIGRRRWTPILVVLYAAGMIAHLLVFIFVPISMALAYIGPSRSFYSFSITALSLAGAHEYADHFITAFNAAMVFVHTINLWFFLRTKTAALFGNGARARPIAP